MLSTIAAHTWLDFVLPRRTMLQFPCRTFEKTSLPTSLPAGKFGPRPAGVATLADRFACAISIPKPARHPQRCSAEVSRRPLWPTRPRSRVRLSRHMGRPQGSPQQAAALRQRSSVVSRAARETVGSLSEFVALSHVRAVQGCCARLNSSYSNGSASAFGSTQKSGWRVAYGMQGVTGRPATGNLFRYQSTTWHARLSVSGLRP